MNKPYKILLIEPDLALADTIMTWLENSKHLVHVLDINTAKRLISIEQWDIIILDIHSSKISDLDITTMIKEANLETATLIIAENIKVDFILAAMENHADALLFKPLKKNEFLKKAMHLITESKKRNKGEQIVLAIGAHPDDVEFGCGGTLVKFQEKGYKINILTLSSGEVGGDPHIRKKEANEAAKLLKAKLYLGKLKDTKISDAASTIQYIEQFIEQIQPTHVYTHSIHDNHQDHRNVFKATVTACRQVANIFCYLSPSSTLDFKPNLFINIDRHLDEKLKILATFRSQIHSRPYLESDLITATARYWGRFCNYHLVEPMEVIKEHLR